MKIEFLIFKPEGKEILPTVFFQKLNWPIHVPETGYRITFLVRRKRLVRSTTELYTGIIMEVWQDPENDEYAKVWVNMGDLTEKIKGDYVEITGWRTISPPPKD